MTTPAPSATTTFTPAETAETAAAPTQSWGHTVLGVARLLIGFTFLWAFLDKLFGLSFSTAAENSWLNGGSPTAGFLGGSIAGGNPFAGVWEFFLSISPITDVLFMVGLLGVGVALMTGIGTRIAVASAAAMYTLMYLAAFPIASNPLYDTHLLMAVVVIAMGGLAAGDHVGLGRQWRTLVKGNRILI